MAAHLIVDATTREVSNMGMKRILAALLLLTLAAPAWGQDYDRGWAAYERGDYATALREWRPLAEQGDFAAQYFLGGMYAMGQSVPQDYAEAVKWYRKAADQGVALAQTKIGSMYAAESAPKDRDRVAKRMTPAQIAEAQRLAREWMEASRDAVARGTA